MRMFKRLFSIVLVLFLIIYLVPVIVEGFKSDTDAFRKKAEGLRTVKVMDHTMAYREYGSGAPVILVHGFSHSALCWERNIDALVKAGHRVYTIDLLGHGLSDKPYGIRYDYSLFSEQILQFMNRLRIGKADLVGHSMGGGAAVHFACLHPDRVNRLVLIGSAGLMVKKSSSLLFTLMNCPLVGEFVVLFNVKPATRNALARLHFKDDRLLTDEYLEGYVLPSRMKGYDYAILSRLRSGRAQENDLSECMKSMNAPVLLIHGSADRVVDIENSRMMKKLIKGSTLAEVKGAPHGVMETDAVSVNRMMTDFLKR